jgi:hypothetical protein
MKELVSVVVPILNPVLNIREEKILAHCVKALAKYPFIFVISESADHSILKEKYPTVDFISFNEKYFESRQTLASLLLMEGFYERFSWSDFLLIHELNSWIVKDELHYWCKQGYDYLRANPAVSGSVLNDFNRLRGLNKNQLKIVDEAFADDGLSLCHIGRFVKTLAGKRKKAYEYRHNENLVNKDSLFWDLESNPLWPSLRRPTAIVQQRFSVNMNAGILIEKTDKESWPFGLTGIDKIETEDLPFFD